MLSNKCGDKIKYHTASLFSRNSAMGLLPRVCLLRLFKRKLLQSLLRPRIVHTCQPTKQRIFPESDPSSYSKCLPAFTNIVSSTVTQQVTDNVGGVMTLGLTWIY